jgi:hypothetical protein
VRKIDRPGKGPKGSEKHTPKQKERQDDAAIREEEQISDFMAVLFDDYLWGVVRFALKDRDGQMKFSEDASACMTHFFENHCPDFVLEDTTTDRNRKRGQIATRLTVPEFWRRVFRKMRRKIEDDRLRYGRFYDFGNAAANLYGAVSEGDLAEIADHWWDSAPWFGREGPGEVTPEERRNICKITAEAAMKLMTLRQESPFAVAYVRNELAISFNKYPPDDANGSIPKGLSETLKLRVGKDRWYPETFDGFMDWRYPETWRGWPDEYEDLKQFILDNWHFDLKDDEDQSNLDNVLKAAHDALASGRMWHGAVDAMRPFLNFSTLLEDEVLDMAKILSRCANATRHDANWGFSPNELVRTKGLGGTFEIKAVPIGFAGAACAPVIQAVAKVGRNDPCPCGSGKKFKKCCGR